MKPTQTHALILITAIIAAVMGLGSCMDSALHIRTPAVQAQVIGDVEKDLLAGGGALLISGGSTEAAVAAMTAQELKNIAGLRKVLTEAKQPVASVTP